MLTCELASVDGVGWTAGRSQPTNRSSLWHLADDLERRLAADRLAQREGAADAAEARTDEEAGSANNPRGFTGEDHSMRELRTMAHNIHCGYNSYELSKNLRRQL